MMDNIVDINDKESEKIERDLFYIRVPNDNESDIEIDDDDDDDNEDENEGEMKKDDKNDEINKKQEKEKEVDFDALIVELNEKYSKIRNDISILIDKKNITKGNWIDEKRVVQIFGKDHLKQYIPIAKCLTPFEALFLQECRSLAIYYNNILLSIEDSYELLLQNEQDVKLYKIFSTLSRVGFYVQQIIPKSIDDNIVEYNNDQEKESSKGIKRTMTDDDDNDEKNDNTKLHKSSNNDQNNNYAIITSIQPLKMENISKLNRMDKELIKHFNLNNNINNNNDYDNNDDYDDDNNEPSSLTESYLYCVKKASRPTILSPLIRPLYNDDKIKPLLPLGSIYNTENLFKSIQKDSPQCYDNIDHIDDNYKTKFHIDFNVFQSQMQKKQNNKPLFSVIVVDEQQSTPSIEDIEMIYKNFINNNNNNNENDVKILFAVIAQFTFNFYSFEKLLSKNKYPRLWEKFYYQQQQKHQYHKRHQQHG